VSTFKVSDDIISAWQAGVIDFNRFGYWDAHKHWEHKWIELPQPQKDDVQAHIQVCGVLVHLKKNNLTSALKLSQSALLKLSSAHWSPQIKILGIQNFLTDFINSTDHDFSHWLSLAEKLKAKVVL